MLKIIFVLMLYIFFVFLIKNKIVENLNKCNCESVPSITDLQTQISNLSTQVSTIASSATKADANATIAMKKANETKEELEYVKKNLSSSGS